MKNKALFSSKDKSKKLKCRLLQFLIGASRVKLCDNKILLKMPIVQLNNLFTKSLLIFVSSATSRMPDLGLTFLMLTAASSVA